MTKCELCASGQLIDLLFEKRDCSNDCETNDSEASSRAFDKWLRNWRFDRLMKETVK